MGKLIDFRVSVMLFDHRNNTNIIENVYVFYDICCVSGAVFYCPDNHTPELSKSIREYPMRTRKSIIETISGSE